MINNKLLKEIKEYCQLNEIEDIDGLINRMLKQGFTIEKYGSLPKPSIKKEKSKNIPKPKSNKYLVDIKVGKENIIEETVKIRSDINENSERDIYGE